MRVTGPRVSYSDLEDAPDTGRRYELYDGEVSVVPAPIPLHQLVVDRLADVLKAYRSTHGGLVFFSPIDVVFSEFDVVQPDIVFFTQAREHLIDLRKPIGVAPDLVAEVLSPTTAATDRGKKMAMFARYGVREYWLADPDKRTVEVYRLAGEAYTIAQMAVEADEVRSIVIPDLSFPARRLFEL